MPDKCVNLIIIDPPYGISGYAQKEITHPGRKKPINLYFGDWDKFEDFRLLINESTRILKRNGTIYIFVSYRIFGTVFDLLDKRFKRVSLFVWHKPNPAIQISKTSYLSSCELILWAHNEKHTFNFTNQREMHNFWEGTYPMGKNRWKHPTAKPYNLISHFIKVSSNEGDIILDPMMGSGVVLRVAKDLYRNFVGIEMNPEYCKIAEERLAQKVL
ncbi:MAG: DNA-methyltransferase [Candidatus Hodarchaeales archaeon]